MDKIIKASLVGYDKKVGEFSRKAGWIRFHPNADKTYVDSITMPQGWKVGTTLDVTLRNGDIARIKISQDQEIDRTQEGLL